MHVPDATVRRLWMTGYSGECCAMTMLATGCIDLAFEPSLQPYDIVTQAGRRGHNAEMASATSTLHAQAQIGMQFSLQP
ncbi:hypothetical protein SAMN05518849_103202 [Sphingobium sp. AP50]|nr:hypothetical protein SAMN05518849_103202 [Sphingobium sp. AP50]